GDLQAAKKKWEEGAKVAGDDHVWGLLINKHLQHIEEAVQLEATLENKVEDMRKGMPYQSASVDEGKAVDAFRYEVLGDFVRARESWTDLQRGMPRDTAHRPLHLLASKKRSDLAKKAMPDKKEEEVLSARIAHVGNRLAQAKKWLNDKETLQDGIYFLREIAYLYRNDPEPKLKELATRADESLPKVDDRSDTAKQGQKP